MQLIDTHVGKHVAGCLTVEFRGEGGELVAVRMALDADLGDAAAVLRARQMLVELTAPEMPPAEFSPNPSPIGRIF